MSVPENPTCEWCKHNDSEGTCQFHKFGTSDDVVACAEYEYDKERYVLNVLIRRRACPQCGVVVDLTKARRMPAHRGGKVIVIFCPSCKHSNPEREWKRGSFLLNIQKTSIMGDYDDR